MKTFRHSTNERNRTNVLKLRMAYGAAGYGVYMMLLERLAEEPDLRTALDYDVLAFDFHVEAELIQHVVEDFDLFIIEPDAGVFHHAELDKQIPKKARQKLQERLVDSYISGRLSDARWLQSRASERNTSPEKIRALLRSSFRDYALESLESVIPDTNRLAGLLFTFLKKE